VARDGHDGAFVHRQSPFRTVYLHGLVRDEHGRKMSKTYNNVIDPLDVMDEYGTDALRFTLLTGSTPGNDMNLSVERIAANRNFANKIWNAARFLISNLGEDDPTGMLPRQGLTLPDRWILSRLHRLIETVNHLFENYQYGEAGRQIYDFVWGEYADWYIEISKIALYGEDEHAKSRTRSILTYVLDQCLRLLHPFVPFVTEEIWQHIPHQGEALIIAPWPEVDKSLFDTEAESQMALVVELIRGIRNVRAEYNVPPGKRIPVKINAGQWAGLCKNNATCLSGWPVWTLSTWRLNLPLRDTPAGRNGDRVSGVTAFLPLAGLVDIEMERERIRRELEEVSRQIERVEQVLSKDGFTQRAPAEVVQREKDKLASLQASRLALEERLRSLD
jgi:valyl-tRNA synthetase